MTDAYIETSSINQALVDTVSGEEISRSLQDLGYRPVVGFHTIYELARTFLNPEQHQTGSDLFKILQGIDCTIVPMTGLLIDKEIIKLRTGAEVLPFLDHANQVSTRYEIEKLSRGIFDATAEQFVATREKERRTNEPIESNQYLEQILEMNRTEPGRFRGIKVFGDALDYFKDAVPSIIQAGVRRDVSSFEAKELSLRLTSFPCIHSLVRANIYLCFIVIRNLTNPAYDRVDDFRQVIDASYCNAFVTNDGQLARTGNQVNTGLCMMRWTDIF